MPSFFNWVFFISLFTIAFSCTNESTKKNLGDSCYLYEDPILEPGQVSASSIPFQFESAQNKLTARILLAQNREPKPTVIFLNGNPGFERNEDIGHALTRNGFNSIFFFYTGSWGNSGIFSFSQCIDDTHSLLKHILDKNRQYKIDTSQLYLIGYSTGADIALLTAQQYKIDLKGMICIDPWHGYNWLKSKSETMLKKYKEMLKVRPAVNIPNENTFVDEIINNEAYNLQHLKLQHLPPTYFVFSSDYQKNNFKSSIQEKLIENSIVLNAANHGFSDKRIALTKTIHNWLLSTSKQ